MPVAELAGTGMSAKSQGGDFIYPDLPEGDSFFAAAFKQI